MKLKFLLVLACLLMEMGYVGRMAFDSDDPELVETLLSVPVVKDLYYEHQVAETRLKAVAGDIHEMMGFYIKAGSLENEADKEFARELLKTSGSPSAELFLFHQEGGAIDSGAPREYMLLVARAMQENIRPYIPTGDAERAYQQQSRQYAAAFETLLKQAVMGNSDAIWVLEKLGITGDDSTTAGNTAP